MRVRDVVAGRSALRLLVVAVLVVLATAAPAAARSERVEPGLRAVVPAPPHVIATARAVPKVARVLRRHPGFAAQVYARATGGWQVAFTDADDEVAQVRIERGTGRVTEAWTGIQVEWAMARGYPGAFGRRAASLPIWIGGLVLFLLPFLRPPWRMLHLDLLVLCSLSVSFAFFSAGDVRVSVPLAYPPLLYLLGRLLHLARRPRAPAPVSAPGWLGLGIVFLIAFRIALQVTNANVIDVGYSGVIGADRLSHLRDLYGAFPADNPHGDTYGPLLYLLYVPFELALPWSGTWDDLPAAHAAATAFDLACAGGLYLVGGRLLAYLWLACPFTLLIANSGANDALIGVIVLAAVARRSGALAAAAAMVKLTPLVLLPLFWRRWRGMLAVLAASALVILVVDGGFDDFWSRAIRFQLDRDSPFSVWGLYDLPALQLVAELLVVVLAVAAARVKHTDRFALAAALLIAVQLTAGHWFYLYLGWVLPVLLVALIGRSTGSIDSARPAASQRTSTPLSHGSSVAVP